MITENDIIKLTSTHNTSIYNNRPIDFLVIHYTAGTTSRKGIARNVASMFGNPNSRAASADFIVDDYEMVQFNPDIRNRYCYAVGGKLQNTYGGKWYGKAKNYNCISIEVCSSNTTGKVVNEFNSSTWYFTDKAISNAIKLSQYLVKKYNIPKDHLVTHFEVNSKPCPNVIGWNTYAGNNDSKWQWFKNQVYNNNSIPVTQPIENKIKEVLNMTKKEFIDSLTNEEAYAILSKANKFIAEKAVDEWAKEDWNGATSKGIVDGQRPNSYIKREEMVTVLKRLGLF